MLLPDTTFTFVKVFTHGSMTQCFILLHRPFNPMREHLCLLIFQALQVITRDSFGLDVLLNVRNKCLYFPKLTFGYETNLATNITRKDKKYQD